MLWLAVALGCAPFLSPCSAAPELPEASEVARRIVERARGVARPTSAPPYTYDKRSLLEELDGRGQTIKTEEKFYRVLLVSGFPFNRLVKIQGRSLTSDELNREGQREERFRRRFTSVDPEKMTARKEGWITPQLLERYQLVVKERVVLDQRPTLVVEFKPRIGDLPERSTRDKLLNRLAGTVWVDEQDADIARLAARLGESISIGWFGFLGSLTRAELSLERRRMPEGVWINARQILLIHFRKLIYPTRLRMTDESSGFEKAPANL